MILLLLLVFIRYYIGRGRLLFCPCSGCKAASLTELGVGYARENSPLRSLLQCGMQTESAELVWFGRCFCGTVSHKTQRTIFPGVSHP